MKKLASFEGEKIDMPRVLRRAGAFVVLGLAEKPARAMATKRARYLRCPDQVTRLVFAVHKANLAVASHTLHIENSNFSWNKYTSLFPVKTALNQNATEGNQMLAALEINFAGWGARQWK